MLKGILSIAGKPGLYKLVNSGRGSLIVEQLGGGKRMPIYSRDRVISLADVAMYTNADDVALGQVLDNLKQVADGKPVDAKLTDGDLREFFGRVLPDFDRDRVHLSDIRKLISWYNLLITAGITDFAEPENEAEAEAEAAEAAE